MKFQASRLVREMGKITKKVPKPVYGDDVDVMVGGEVEFHFIDGPLETPPYDEMVAKIFKGPYFAWWDTHDAASGTSTTHAQSFRHRGDVVYVGIDTAVSKVVDCINQYGPFDALMGFSQGAMLVNIMSFLRAYLTESVEEAISQGNDVEVVLAEVSESLGLQTKTLRNLLQISAWKVGGRARPPVAVFDCFYCDVLRYADCFILTLFDS